MMTKYSIFIALIIVILQCQARPFTATETAATSVTESLTPETVNYKDEPAKGFWEVISWIVAVFTEIFN